MRGNGSNRSHFTSILSAAFFSDPSKNGGTAAGAPSQTARRRIGFAGRHRFGRHGHGRSLRYPLYSRGICRPTGGQRLAARRGRRCGIGRRRRQNPVSHRRSGSADERRLRRRHRLLYRSDGRPDEAGAPGNGRTGRPGRAGLYHCLPLRRLCQIGYSAFKAPKKPMWP